MNEPEKLDFENVEAVNEKVRNAVRKALSHHKDINNPVPSWNGKEVEMVQPKDLPSQDDPKGISHRRRRSSQ